jgi:hypothetical protein
MKTSEAFKLAKAKLNEGKTKSDLRTDFICIAASNAGGTVRDIVQPIIKKLLGRHYVFDDWLISQNINIHIRGDEVNKKKIQKTRHAWLDHLIAYYSVKGN